MSDVWHHGNVTLYLGDCADILPALDCEYTAVITDPPYGIHKQKATGFQRERVDVEANQWDERPLDETILLIKQFSPICVIWGFGYFASLLGDCVAPLVWDKKTGKNYFADGELAWTSFPTGTLRIFRHQWCGCFKDSERGEKAVHPTQKPVALMGWCIEKCDRYGTIETVIDPMMGSGTTGVACVRMGKEFIGMEKRKQYFDIAVQRIEKEQNTLTQPHLEGLDV